MKGFKQCEKGHFFKENLTECPYCPKSSTPAPDAKTRVSGSESGNDKTSLGNKTQIAGGSPTSRPVVNAPRRDLNKTYIQEVEEVETGSGGEKKEVVSQRATRRIVGWLISYTLDPMGIDFRIYEGNNTVGRNPDNDISIPDDASVSGRHATILFKKGRFFVRDEMAANGTFINGEELELSQPIEMVDGNELKLGKTVFKFKTPL